MIYISAWVDVFAWLRLNLQCSGILLNVLKQKKFKKLKEIFLNFRVKNAHHRHNTADVKAECYKQIFQMHVLMCRGVTSIPPPPPPRLPPPPPLPPRRREEPQPVPHPRHRGTRGRRASCRDARRTTWAAWLKDSNKEC